MPEIETGTQFWHEIARWYIGGNDSDDEQAAGATKPSAITFINNIRRRNEGQSNLVEREGEQDFDIHAHD
jgi:hypothetical protein